LLKAVIPHELQLSRDAWQHNPHIDLEQWLAFELDRYLNLRHVRHPEAGCMLPSLGAEIARADDSVRQVFEEEMLRGVALLERRLGSEELAWAFICQLVGAVMMARAMPNKAAQLAVLESSRRFLLKSLLAVRES